MTVLSDKWIKKMAKKESMIKPFVSKQKRKGNKSLILCIVHNKRNILYARIKAGTIALLILQTPTKDPFKNSGDSTSKDPRNRPKVI